MDEIIRIDGQGQTLAHYLRDRKLHLACGGTGKCGKCRVYAAGELSEISPEELALLSKSELAAGIRLACCARALGPCEVTLPEMSESMNILERVSLPEFEYAPVFSRYALAVDCGTTTVAAVLLGHQGIIGGASCENSQREFGDDIIARLAAARDNSEQLAALLRGDICTLAQEIAADCGIDCREIDRLCITGNTAILHLLCALPVDTLLAPPYDGIHLFGEYLSCAQLGLSCFEHNTPCYIPPCPAAYVGADITCAMLACGFGSGKSLLLCDIGTNGEVALQHGGKIYCASTAAGPALEGGGIECAGCACHGAVEHVAVKDGRLHLSVIGGGSARTICGSGIIDALCALREVGAIEESGALAKRSEFVRDGRVFLSDSLSLTQQDIRALQLAKGAISAGIAMLAEQSGIGGEVKLWCAGGFGEHMNIESCVKIGLFEPFLAQDAHSAGNAALTGAAMILLDSSAGTKAEHLAASAFVVELAGSEHFSELFVDRLSL